MKQKELRKAIKCKFKTIIKDDNVYNKLLQIINKSNNVKFVCSNMINAYILYKFNNNLQIPNINYNFFRMAFKAISKTSVGPKPKNNNKIIYDDICIFLKTEGFKLFTYKQNCDINNYKLNSTNLSYIFNSYCIEMETNFINNITQNFFKYVHQYVNETFIKRTIKKLTHNEFKKLSVEQQEDYKNKLNIDSNNIKLLRSELMKIKNDLCNNIEEKDYTSDKKYHIWINKQKNKILPPLINKTLNYEQDIKINYQQYLKYMLIMNKELESKNYKLFKAIPSRTRIIDQYITIDTSTLKDIFSEVNTNKTNVEIWDKYFDISFKKYKIKGYSFNDMIQTNGFAVSIIFIKNSEIIKKQTKIKAMHDASLKTKLDIKNLSIEERNIYMEQKKNKILQNKINQQINQKNIKDKFKNLSKKEQDKIRLKIKNNKNKFEYIEDLIKNKTNKDNMLKELQENNIKVIDPGMRSPMTILGHGTQLINGKSIIGKIRNNCKKKHILFSYTSGNRITEIKRIKYIKLLNNKKKNIQYKNKSIDKIEAKLSKYSSKTTNYDKFIKYARKKIRYRLQLNKINCYNEYVKKLKWFSYINKKRHEDNLLNKIEKIYGKNAKFIIGDWSQQSKIKRLGMPNMGIKKLLLKKFKCYLIDEYNTSKLNYKTEKEQENLIIKNKYEKDCKIVEKSQKLHSVFTFTMGNKGKGCINRDYNATLNLYKIVSSLLKTGKRPNKFIRNKNHHPKGVKVVREP